MQEQSLGGGRTTTGVVRVADTVRRPIGPNAPLVHELLRHLERGGFPGAPRLLGIDEAGREILSYLPGDVPGDLGHFSAVQLLAAARLLRRFHDATAGSALRGDCEVVCHGDASPCNCVFSDGLPYALIDFDAAQPGTRRQEVGYAAWLWLDLGNDDLDAVWQGGRLRDFIRSYGALPASEAVAYVLEAQHALSERMGAPAGVREWARWCRAWTVRNRTGLRGGMGEAPEAGHPSAAPHAARG